MTGTSGWKWRPLCGRAPPPVKRLVAPGMGLTPRGLLLYSSATRTQRRPSMRSRLLLFLITAGLALSLPAPAAAQAPIKVGEINSYSGIGAPFTGPYKAGVEMAVEEINAKGGV